MKLKKIITKSIGKDFVQSNYIILEETPETLLVFKPEMHPRGVRGTLVRLKKDKKREWEKLKKSDFVKLNLKPGTKFEIELSTNSLKKLISSIEEREKIVKVGIKSGETEYIVAERDQIVVVDDGTKKEIFEKILQKGYSDELWSILRESEPELATRLSSAHIHAEKNKVLEELEIRLQGNYPETAGPDSWQKWIYKNNWIFGINYIEVIEKAKINIPGSTPDYLFLTADGFVDILEIKLPKEEVIIEDSSHTGSYRWCAETNKSVGQVVTYLNEAERLSLELKKEIKRVYNKDVSFVKPRGFILIGNKFSWDDFKKEGLRKLNYSLHGLEILTYSDLLQRGKEIVQMY